MTPITAGPPPYPASSWLNRPLAGRLTPTALGLGAIFLLALVLNFSNLQSIGDANIYYTAAVESMLQSAHNFFFVAAEPGGSVTVDKPPLGLWIEALSAAVLGVNGLAVILPNILAGLAAIGVLFHLVRRDFGSGAGLLAALALAVTPVAVAAQRNNTMDSMLTLLLLLAAWAFLNAARSGRSRPLYLGALLLGLAFNVKMLQAFLPLPVFYAVYLLGARRRWAVKIGRLLGATLLLLVVSLSWAVVVDLVPGDQRPYIGSSTDNSVMELIIGHNGAARLFGPGRNGGSAGGQPARPGALPAPPAGRPAPPANGAPGGGAPGALGDETGSAGLLRFFQAPLANELSWLLPLGLLGGLLALFGSRLTWPLGRRHAALLLWGGWLGTGLIFFSFAGLFHAYYLIMLAPPLAALVGAGGGALVGLGRRRPPAGLLLLTATALLTLAVQALLVSYYDLSPLWVLAALLPAGGGLLLALGRRNLWEAAAALTLGALLLTPLAWSVLTVFQPQANVALPAAYAGSPETARPAGPGQDVPATAALLPLLSADTSDVTYLLAVPNAHAGAPYVLATGRPVLYMGGFSGGDAVADADDIAALVAAGELRYVIDPGRQKGDISAWLAGNCAQVAGAPASQPAGPRLPDGAGGGGLYRCGS